MSTMFTEINTYREVESYLAHYGYKTGHVPRGWSQLVTDLLSRN